MTTGRSKEKHFEALAALIPAVMRILCPFALPADALHMTDVADIHRVVEHEVEANLTDGEVFTEPKFAPITE